MRITAEDHSSHPGHAFPVVAVNDSHTGRHIDSAVLMRCRKRELMIILIDRSADRAQCVVTVGQNIRHRELFHSGSPGSLNDADIGDIMARQGVIGDVQDIGISMTVMRIQNAVCHGPFSSLFARDTLRRFTRLSVYIEYPVVFQFHIPFSPLVSSQADNLSAVWMF